MQPMQSQNRQLSKAASHFTANALELALQFAQRLIENDQQNGLFNEVHIETRERLSRLVNAYSKRCGSLSAEDATNLVHIVQSLQQWQQ